MRILLPNRRTSDISLSVTLIYSLLLACFLLRPDVTKAAAQDLKETLAEYGDSEYGEAMREKVRARLSGREDEIWNYVKEAWLNGDGMSDRMAITAGIRALHDLNGFNEKILADYAGILEAESRRVKELNDLLARTPPIAGVAPDDEFDAYYRAVRAKGLIGSSFFVFETYGNGLTREIALKFLHLNDGYVQTAVAEWFKTNGDRNDIPVLKARAAALQSRGDKYGSDLVLTVIDEIQLRSSPTATEAEEPSSDEKSSKPVSQSSDWEIPSSSDGDPEEESLSTHQIVWLYAVVALSLIGIVFVLVRSRNGATGR